MFCDELGVQLKRHDRRVSFSLETNIKTKGQKLRAPKLETPRTISYKAPSENWLVLHYQGTTNTLTGPRERPGKPHNPTAHKNDVACSTADQHGSKPKNKKIDNSLQ